MLKLIIRLFLVIETLMLTAKLSNGQGPSPGCNCTKCVCNTVQVSQDQTRPVQRPPIHGVVQTGYVTMSTYKPRIIYFPQATSYTQSPQTQTPIITTTYVPQNMMYANPLMTSNCYNGRCYIR